MLSNPVKGFSGSNLNELGECACVITANQAMSAEEIEEVFYLVFPSTFVILAVGSSLSGYELKVSKGLMRILILSLYTSLEIHSIFAFSDVFCSPLKVIMCLDE